MSSVRSLQTLRGLGLNSYEVKIWMALLSKGKSTAGELSDIANVPRSRSYDVLESLEQKGFVQSTLGKPITYVAVSPKEVITRVQKNVENKAKEALNTLSELKNKEVFGELQSLHNQGADLVEPTELSGTLKGRQNLYNHLELTIKNAKDSVVIMTTTQGLVRKTKELSPTLEKLSKKGVRVTLSAPLTKENKQAASQLQKFATVKNTSTKARVCVVDGKEIIFMMLDDAEVHPAYDVGVWVRSSFAQQLQKTIESSCL